MQIRHLTFRLLQVFADVVRSGSITETAHRLHLTQPTVSQQLKRLREAVGEPLLDQIEGRQVPTEVGNEVYQLSQDILSRMDAFSQTLEEHRSGERGHFSIALVSTAQYVLPRLLGAFSQAMPNIDVTLNIGNRQEILNRFDRHEDDLYVFSHPPQHNRVRSVPFLSNPLVLVASVDSAWASHRQVTITDLLEARFLLRESGSATRHAFDTWLQSQGLVLNNTQYIASNEAIREAVAAGMGLGVLSRHVLARQDARIAEIEVEGMPLGSQWHFVVRNERKLPPVARQFLHRCADIIPELFPEEGTGQLDELARF